MIARRFEEIVASAPQSIAIIAGGRTWTYQDLLDSAGRAARGLERHGVQPQSTVVVSLPSSERAVASFIACASLGAIFVPVNPAWRAREVEWIAAQTRPAAILIARPDLSRWIEAGVERHRVIFDDELDGVPRGGAGPTAPWPADHPAAYLATSGTQGSPRLVARTHAMVVDSVDATARIVPAGPGRQCLATVPFHHGSGFSNNLCLPLLTGATLVLQDRFDPAEAVTLIDRHQVDTVVTSPSVFSLIDHAAGPAAPLRSLTTCLSGGAALAPDVAARWRAAGRTPIRQFYGSTETGLVTVQMEDCPDPACVGSPLPGSAIALLDGQTPVEAGAIGQVAIRGPGVCRGYVGESGGAHFWSGFLCLSDRGWLDARGHLHLAGRITPFINLGGVKVDPAEVRQVLTGLPGVLDAGVDAAAGPRGTDIVAAVIVLAPGATLTRADVIQHCRGSLAEFKIPRQIRFVAAGDLEATGKLPRALPDP